MKYWHRYPGDWARDTAHLNLAEQGAYSILLDAYYGKDQPLPEDYPSLFRLARAMTEDEQKAVMKVAFEFFPVSEADGLRHNKRADEEIAKAVVRIAAAKVNGKKGGRPPKPK